MMSDFFYVMSVAVVISSKIESVCEDESDLFPECCVELNHNIGGKNSVFMCMK